MAVLTGESNKGNPVLSADDSAYVKRLSKG